MMIAKTAAVAPTAVSTQSANETQYDGLPFASVLDEKTTAGTVIAQLPQIAKAGTSVEQTDPSDKGDEQDLSEPEDASLLLILNQIQGADTDAKKADASQDAPSQPDEPDGTDPLAPAIDMALPLGALTPHVDVQTEPLLAASSGIHSDTQSVASSNEKATLRSLSAVAGEIDSGASAGDSAAGSPAGEVAKLTQSLPLREANLAPAKENLVTRGSEQAETTPEFTSPVVGPEARQAEAANISTVGVLPQVPGTPAWQQSLGHQVAWFARGGVQHAELRLHPEELGSIHISLQLKEDQAQLHFVSASHQVRAAIEAAVPHLRTSLAESGIELEQSSVGAETASRENDSGPSGQTPQKKMREQNAPNSSAVTDIITETPARTGGYNRGVNIFA